MKKIGIIIFARASSKRLPKKVLKIINRKTLLEIIYLRIKKTSKRIPVIINTSKSRSDDEIVNFCKRKKVKYFRGSLTNVIERTIECCKNFKLDGFVRVNADRPFLDFDMIKSMMNFYISNNYHIVTNQLPRSCPKGLACEIASTSIFKNLNLNKLNKNDKEHIFNYFYRNKNNYKIFNYRDNFYNKKKKLNLSLDTKKDYSLVKKIYESSKLEKIINFKTKKIIKKFGKLFYETE